MFALGPIETFNKYFIHETQLFRIFNFEKCVYNILCKLLLKLAVIFFYSAHKQLTVNEFLKDNDKFNNKIFVNKVQTI